jgi:thiamine-phosphate pyrophosphorylase
MPITKNRSKRNALFFFLFLALSCYNLFSMRSIDWRLCLVADAEAAGPRDLVSIVREAAEAGATLIQLRGKKLEIRQFLDVAVRVSHVLNRMEIPLIVNDRIDIALACGADGVHLGQDDLPLAYARKIMGKEKIIGISVNTLEQAEEAESGGADYIGAGPLFYTASKEELGTILGPDGLLSIRQRVRIPILAIGGITADRVKEAFAAGADGIAVISAIIGAENVHDATKKLLYEIDEFRSL